MGFKVDNLKAKDINIAGVKFQLSTILFVRDCVHNKPYIWGLKMGGIRFLGVAPVEFEYFVSSY